MALAALSSMVVDMSAPAGALTAASIVAPCILGSPVDQPQPESIPGMLLCHVGSCSAAHSLAISSASADGSQKSTCHLTASAAMLSYDGFQPAKTCARSAVSSILRSISSLEDRRDRQHATVASTAPLQACKGLGGYTVHPAAADSALHLGAVAGDNSKGPSRVPVGFGAYKAATAGEVMFQQLASMPAVSSAV